MVDRPRLLGAILAGGRARRFGTDKALALLDGKPLIAHVAEALAAQTDQLAVCGRDWGGLQELADRPGTDAGPLAGLNAALHHGAAHGFDALLVAPVDVLPLPGDLVRRLGGEGVGVFARQFAVGYWPVALAGTVDGFLGSGRRALNELLDMVDARRVPDPEGLVNVNRPDDLDRLQG